MLGLAGAGAIAGSFAAPAIQRRLHPKVVVIGSLAIWALAALAQIFALAGLMVIVAVTATVAPSIRKAPRIDELLAANA